MTLPNVITIGRCFMVPVLIWLLAYNYTLLAFLVFVAAGLSDAVDGFLARLLDQRSKLGAVLDPLADKLLLASAFSAVAWMEHVPVWLATLVIGRDLLLVVGIAVALFLGHAIRFEAIFVSKLATLFQIAFIAIVLADLAFSYPLPVLTNVLMWAVALFTFLSALAYGVSGVRTLCAPAQEPHSACRKV